MAIATSPRQGGFTQAAVGELFLGLGLLSLTLGLSLVQTVMIGLFLGIPAILAALLFLVLAGTLVRSPTASGVRSAIGLVVFLVGVVLLVGTSGQALTIAYDWAHYKFQPLGAPPTEVLWPWLMFGGPGAAAVLAFGLWLRGGGLDGRVFFWAVVAALVGPVAVLLYSTLAAAIPSLLDA